MHESSGRGLRCGNGVILGSLIMGLLACGNVMAV